MKTALTILLLFLALTVGGCAEKRAEELLDTARLEERQNNMDHARRLYEEILEDYPDTDSAAAARRRLAEWESGDDARQMGR